MKNLAVIPARCGSKGILNKNIRSLAGKPLMAYSIEAAIDSGMYDTIHVSTDSEEYAEIARSYGAEVPFLRPQAIASDSSNTWDTVRYVLEKYQEAGQVYDTVTVLQPTSPLRTARHIKESFQLMQKKQAEYIVGVCKTEHSPLLCNTLDETLSAKDFIPRDILLLPRQQLSDYYHINGAMYLMKPEILYRTTSIYESDCYAYVMDSMASVDIDEELDFLVAEQILQINYERK